MAEWKEKTFLERYSKRVGVVESVVATKLRARGLIILYDNP
jgi:hypothetical protein